MSKTKKLDLVATIRQAICESELSPYRICRDADVDRAAVSRFIHRQRGLNLDTASRICEVLGLELRPVRRGATKGR